MLLRAHNLPGSMTAFTGPRGNPPPPKAPECQSAKRSLEVHSGSPPGTQEVLVLKRKQKLWNWRYTRPHNKWRKHR